MKNVTIADVAQAAGVSKATMSRFLNHNYSHMSEKTRQHIADTVAALNYRPNRQAQSLKSKRSNLIGVMIADISDIYSSLLLKGIGDVLKPLNYQMLIMDSANSANQEKQQLIEMIDQSVDGIILQPDIRDNQQYQFIADADTKLVMVDRKTTPLRWNTVSSNNFDSSKRLGQEVAKTHATRATFLIEPLADASTREDRYQGFLAGATDNNLPVDLIELPADRFDEIPAIIHRLIADTKHPVVFAGNGKILMRILTIVQKDNIDIPNDLAVTGYDDWNWAGLVGPGITTVEQDFDYIGRLAAETLMDLITQKQDVTLDTPLLTELPARLEIRHSL